MTDSVFVLTKTHCKALNAILFHLITFDEDITPQFRQSLAINENLKHRINAAFKCTILPDIFIFYASLLSDINSRD